MSNQRHKIDISVDAKTGRAQSALHDVGDAAGKSEKQVGQLDRALVEIGGRKFSISDIATGFTAMTNAAGLAFQVVSKVAGAIKDIADRADEIGDVFGNLELDIAPAREATRGLVNDLELARLANLATSTGVAKNAEEFARLATVADAAAVRLGQDTPAALKTLTEALASGRTAALKKMGVMVDKTAAERKYALQLGVTVDALSDAERAEAFRADALSKLEKSTAHVTRGTDGAAVAVKRGAVELENWRDRALGATTGAGSFRHEMVELAKRGLLPTAEQAKASGGHIYDLTNRLRDAGVNFEQTRKTIQEWAVEIDLAREAAQEFSDTIRDEVLKQGEHLIKTFARSFTEERVHQIDKEVLALKGVSGTSEHINELLAEKNQLLIHEARLLGDVGRARALERQEELRQLQHEVDLENKKPKRGSKKKEQDPGLDAILGKGAEERWQKFIKRTQDADKAVEEMFEGWAEAAAANDPFSPANLEIQRRALEDRLALQRVHDEHDLQQRLNHVEELHAAGVDPIVLIEREQQARLAFLETELARAEKLKDVVSAERIRGQIEQTQHDARMARLHEERLAVEETRAKWEYFTVTASELHLNFAQNVARAVLMQGESLMTAVANVAKAEAMEFGLIQGPSELIRAAIAGASFNYPKMATHLANAGAAFAHGAAMGAIAGVAGAASGSGSSGGGRPAVTMPTGSGGPAANDTRGDQERFGGVPTSIEGGTAQQIQRPDDAPKNVVVFESGAMPVFGKLGEAEMDQISTDLQRKLQTAG